MEEAARQRHMVRKYLDKPLPPEIAAQLTERVDEHNAAYGSSMKLMVHDANAVGPIVKLLLAKKVKNYVILAGNDGDDLDERLGWCGADLMLYAQTLGLNTWWVGSTFNRGISNFVPGKKVIGIIAVGYGATQGVPHRSRTVSEIADYEGAVPAWFARGAEFSLLAPTALNKQDYHLSGRGNRVRLDNDNGTFTGVNRGILKYHFELGAGTENFQWE